MACYLTLEALYSFPLCSLYKVADKVSAVQFICRAELPLLHSSASERRTIALFSDKV